MVMNKECTFLILDIYFMENNGDGGSYTGILFIYIYACGLSSTANCAIFTFCNVDIKILRWQFEVFFVP